MKVRVLSASVGIVFAILILFFYESIVLNLAVSLICSIIVYEIFSATQMRVKSFIVFIVSEIFAIIFPFLKINQSLDLRLNVIIIYFIFLILVLLKKYNVIKINELVFSASFSVFVTFCITNIIYIRDDFKPYSLYYILLLCLISWICDAGAYFVGVKFGKNKLTPEISPNKTVEGVIGGIISVFLVMLIFNLTFFNLVYKNIQINFITLILIICLGIVFSILGDLVASVIKRQYNIKDFGNIMPGHGGFLDRFDSLILVFAISYPIISTYPIII